MRSVLPVFASLILVAFAGGASAESRQAAGSRAITFAPCRLEHPNRVAGVAAECGSLTVLENPANAAGRKIQLRVARVPAVSKRKAADPLFVIAGGPGMAATAFYPGVAPVFGRINRDRDIVLIDQRGTGGSNALSCELDEEVLFRATDETVAAETKRCMDSLASRADLKLYTTSIAVGDLDQVREALGYEQINLYGVSYGTRVTQHYVRRFPERSRAVILDGVVSPQQILGPAIALDAEKALASILQRCAADAACAAKFGDPVVTYRELLAQLRAHPVVVTLPNPTTGVSHRMEFGELHLGTVLRLASYATEQAALLPLSLHLAKAQDNFTPLAAQFLMVSRSYDEQVAFGMHNSVVCADDIPYIKNESVDRPALERSYMGASQLDGLRQICALWPRGPVDADFHAPLKSDVPALLLSGSSDPVTPPEYARQAQKGFSHSVHVIMEGFGHGQLGAPCVDRLMSRVIQRGSVDQLDVSCTRLGKPMPFFTTLAGPAP